MVNATVTPFGDRAYLIELEDVAATHRLATALDRARSAEGSPPCLDEPVVGHGNLVVRLDGDRGPPDAVESWLVDFIERTESPRSEPPGPSPASAGPAAEHRPLEIPVIFDGPDLAEVASLIHGTRRSVIELLTRSELQVAFVGFAPGFPYLVGLPPDLASIPRRPTPRPSVPAGSVAVAGGFASVYPGRSPGGWMLLGRTSTRLFDPGRTPYALLAGRRHRSLHRG